MSFYSEPQLVDLIKGFEFCRHDKPHKVIEVLRSSLEDTIQAVIVRVYSDEDFEAVSDYYGE